MSAESRISRIDKIVLSDKEDASILSYKEMTDESVKPVLNTLAGYEANHEALRFL